MLIGNPMVFRQLPLEMALAKTVDAGFDALELWPPQIAECRTPALRRQLAKHICSLGATPLRLNCADCDYFQALRSAADVATALEGLKADIDMAVDLGMTQLLTWEGRQLESYAAHDLDGWVLDLTCDLFREALRYASARGVELTVEVHPFTLGINVDWLARLFDHLDAPNFSVTYDCCHFGIGLPDGYVHAIDRLSHRIGHVHFSDSDKHSSELHFAPGTGCLDLDGIVDALERNGYRGTMMLDLWLYPLPEEGTRIGVPYVRNVMRRLRLADPPNQGVQRNHSVGKG
ncbi:MAG: sugar phosphate isomerase/epimerase family protein [Pirellulales bacterium]